jgi:hypothetical protein
MHLVFFGKSGVTLCKHEMESFFGNNVSTWSEYRQILDRRIRDVYVETYV